METGFAPIKGAGMSILQGELLVIGVAKRKEILIP